MRNTTRSSESVKDKSTFSLKEKIVAGIALLGCAAFVIGVLKADEAQRSGIRNSLSQEASEKVLGFAGLLPGEGETPQTIVNEVRNAKVQLENGTVCNIQYATHGEGFFADLFNNQATLVSVGTCPTE